VLTYDASACQDAILLLLRLGQLSSWRFLLGGLALGVQFLYPLIAAVGSTLDLFLDGDLTPLEQCDIVLASFADGHTDDFARLVLYDNLRFLGVAFLLATIILPLFF
jgi:hypothetical protein